MTPTHVIHADGKTSNYTAGIETEKALSSPAIHQWKPVKSSRAESRKCFTESGRLIKKEITS